MAAPAVMDDCVLDRLLGMFVDPAASGQAAMDRSPTQQQHEHARPTKAPATAAAPRVAFGYKVIPLNLLNGQQLAKPQVLAGTGALALHGLLMKLHSADQQKQPLLRDAASAVNLPDKLADGQEQPRGFDRLPGEVRKLVPDELVQNGQAVLVQQLQQYLQSHQQLEGRQQQQKRSQSQQHVSYRAPAEHQQHHQKVPDDHHGLQGACSNAASSSCSDTSDLPAQQHVNDQQTGAEDMVQDPIQDAATRSSDGDLEAAAETGIEAPKLQPADVLNQRLSWLTAEEMAAYLDQQLQRQQKAPASMKPPAAR